MGSCPNFNIIPGGTNRTSGANCLCQVWGKHISPTKGRKTELNCRFYWWNHKQGLDTASTENTLDPDTGVYIYFKMVISSPPRGIFFHRGLASNGWGTEIFLHDCFERYFCLTLFVTAQKRDSTAISRLNELKHLLSWNILKHLKHNSNVWHFWVASGNKW